MSKQIKPLTAIGAVKRFIIEESKQMPRRY